MKADGLQARISRSMAVTPYNNDYMDKIRIVRITTVPISLDKLLTGQLKYMSGRGCDVTMISSPGNNTDILAKREDSKFIAISMTRVISPVKDLVALIKLTGVLRQIRPSIVHTHTPKAGLLGMIAAWFSGVPVRLHTVAGLPLMEATGVKRKILEFVEWLTYKFATGVYPNSKKLEEFIIAKKFSSPSKTKVIGLGSSNGINTNYFTLTPEINVTASLIKKDNDINPNDFVYVFIGRLVRDKGIEELITSFTELNKEFINTKLLLVGPTEPDLDPLSAKSMAEIKQNPHIVHFGYQSDIRPYLAVSNVLVFPSYREGFPNVPMQAGCFNLPSIVTNINGCNEIIDNGKNGLVIPVKDVDALQSAMRLLLVDKMLYFKMQANARPMIVERFEQQNIWELIYLEYCHHLKIHDLV
jgi:glycosyltransferase involved in cell wall biosynthesis